MDKLFPAAPRKILPQEITTYDLFKSFAVVLMIIDHVGFYFFPENMWWRAAGRICVPVWFFLVGYAHSRDMGVNLWVGALALLLANPVVGMPFLPMNILVTIVLVSLWIDPVMNRSASRPGMLWGMVVLLCVLMLPTMIVTEYGTMAILLAMFGWVMRHPDKLNWPNNMLELFMAAIVAIFVGSQAVIFGLSQPQLTFMGLGVFAVFVSLYFFRPKTLPEFSASLPGPVRGLLKFTGRETLEIYVVHLLVFKLCAVLLGSPYFGWLDFSLLQ